MRSSTGEGGSEPGGGEGAGAAASWLSSAVGEKVDELLRCKENRTLLEGVEDAERRARRHRAPGGRRAPRPRGSSSPREVAPARDLARRGAPSRGRVLLPPARPLPFSLLFFSLLPCFSLPSIRAEAIAPPSALPSPSPLAASLSWETAAGRRGRRRCSPVCTPPCFSLSLRFVLSLSLSLSLADGRNKAARRARTSSGSVETQKEGEKTLICVLCRLPLKIHRSFAYSVGGVFYTDKPHCRQPILGLGHAMRDRLESV